MFTTNYLNLIKGGMAYNLSGSYYSAAITANVKFVDGTTASKVYSRATSSTGSAPINYAIALYKELIFAGTPTKISTDAGTIGNMYFTVANKESISPDDYTIDRGHNDDITVGAQNGDINITVSNAGSESFTINTIQVSAVFKTDPSTDNSNGTQVLLAEIDIGQQTIAPGYSKTFRLIRDNIQ